MMYNEIQEVASTAVLMSTSLTPSAMVFSDGISEQESKEDTVI